MHCTKNNNTYSFDPELKAYSKIHAPLNPAFVSFMQKPMRLLYSLEHDDECVHIKKTSVAIDSKTSIRVLIYEPKNCNETLPCIYFLHGGGFVFNAAFHHFSLARRFTRELKIKTILADYRLAPKYKFPTAVNDCLKVYKWLVLQANNLEIDHQNIVVAGDSAGGNLAVGTSIAAKSKGITIPKAQMLLYPVLDRRMQTESYKVYTDTPMCNSLDMKKYFKMYVENKNNVTPDLVQYLSPLESPYLEEMPPTYIETAQYDCLHDEGVQFARALEKCNVPVELHEIKNAMHGYDIAKDSNFINKIMAQRIEFLRTVFA